MSVNGFYMFLSTNSQGHHQQTHSSSREIDQLDMGIRRSGSFPMDISDPAPSIVKTIGKPLGKPSIFVALNNSWGFSHRFQPYMGG